MSDALRWDMLSGLELDLLRRYGRSDALQLAARQEQERRAEKAALAAGDLRRQRDALRAVLVKAGGLLAGIYDDVMADTPITYPGEVGDLHDEIEAVLARCT